MGNELGRGEPKRARRAVHTVIVLELALMALVVAVGFAVRYLWGRLFTDDPEVPLNPTTIALLSVGAMLSQISKALLGIICSAMSTCEQLIKTT